MKFKIILLQPEPGFHIKGIQELSDALVSIGYLRTLIYLNDPDVKQEIQQELNTGRSIIFSQNFRGWEFIRLIKSDFYFYTTMDTPYNKINEIKSLDDRCVISLADKTHLDLCRELNPKANFFYNPAFSVAFEKYKNIQLIENRKFDVLFLGRLGFDKIDFSHKSWLERRYVPSITKKAFYPGNKQIHELVESRLRWYKKSGISKIDFNSVEFFDYCWKLGHKIRSDRRVFVLNELYNLNKDIKICFVSDSSDFIKSHTNPNYTVLPFQPWEKVVDIMNDTKVVINVQPYHLFGLHERLCTAMAMGCLSISDKNLLMTEKYTAGSNILMYDFVKGNLTSVIEDILDDKVKLKKIAEKGRELTLKEDMPINRVRTLIQFIDSIEKNKI